MILKEDMYKYTEKRQQAKLDSLADDDFFNRSFHPEMVKVGNPNFKSMMTNNNKYTPGFQFETLMRKSQ